MTNKLIGSISENIFVIFKETIINKLFYELFD